MKNREVMIKSKERDPWILLAAGVVREAMLDLKNAIKYGDKGEEKHLKNWFLSDYGQLLSGNHGEYIIEQITKGVN